MSYASGGRIAVTFETQGLDVVKAKLDTFFIRLEDMQPALLAIKISYSSMIAENFATQANVNSASQTRKWAKLSKTRLDERSDKPGPILDYTGVLKNAAISGGFVGVGARSLEYVVKVDGDDGVDYAAVMQYGGKSKLTGGDIPPRPFMPGYERLTAVARKEVNDYIIGGWNESPTSGYTNLSDISVTANTYTSIDTSSGASERVRWLHSEDAF